MQTGTLVIVGTLSSILQWPFLKLRGTADNITQTWPAQETRQKTQIFWMPWQGILCIVGLDWSETHGSGLTRPHIPRFHGFMENLIMIKEMKTVLIFIMASFLMLNVQTHCPSSVRKVSYFIFSFTQQSNTFLVYLCINMFFVPSVVYPNQLQIIRVTVQTSQDANDPEVKNAILEKVGFILIYYCYSYIIISLDSDWSEFLIKVTGYIHTGNIMCSFW